MSNTQHKGYEKNATASDWLQTLDLGCIDQAGDLYHLLDDEAKERLIDYVVSAMHGVPHDILIRQIIHLKEADSAYGEAVAERLKTELTKNLDS